MEQASPQLEDGHTRIANELLEAIIKYPFNGAEFKIIFAIVRKTYGWKKKKAIISYGAMARQLKVDLRYIKRLMIKLAQDKVIFKEKLDQQNLVGLNKDYKSWRLWKTDKAGGDQTTTLVVA